MCWRAGETKHVNVTRLLIFYTLMESRVSQVKCTGKKLTSGEGTEEGGGREERYSVEVGREEGKEERRRGKRKEGEILLLKFQLP